MQLHNINQVYTPGQTYFGKNDYIEYLSGDLPLILTAPHGGYLKPTSIPDRNCDGCLYLRDSYTQELARELAKSIQNTTGRYPHLIINRLHRKKMDANREIAAAADGNLEAEISWYEFHNFIDSAKRQISATHSKGLYLDLHGHAHDTQLVELGYLITKDELRLNGSALNNPQYIDSSSIRNLVYDNLGGYSHSELLRGSKSFGTMLEERGFQTIPSSNTPYPKDDALYFRGGYNTQRHSSNKTGTIDGIQIECNSNLRFDSTKRKRFADSLTFVILDYLKTHYFSNFLMDQS